METPMLLHVITLALGLIIAIGLQQFIALFQRRKRDRRIREQAAPPTQEPPQPASAPHE